MLASMRILGERWEDGYLDEALRAGAVRVRPVLWIPVVRVEDAFFVRPRSWRLIYNYWREIGFVHSMQKVSSRMRERLRNDRYLCCGVGELIEVHPEKPASIGDWVTFIAPNHLRAMERVVLPSSLVRTTKAPAEPADRLIVTQMPKTRSDAFRALVGWAFDSGQPLAAAELDRAFDEATRIIESAVVGRALDTRIRSPIRERSQPIRPRQRDRPSAVLFGLGNYAKTIVLPSVKRHLDVRVIHEIDPAQAGKVREGKIPALDTSPWPRPDERHDAWLIAGYHHTHAPLAVEAIRRGAAAVIEKPIATNREDLDALAAALSSGAGRAFACFQRRYLPFNAWARRDLAVGPGEPISYHCVVYEVPLPRLHWYRWPASRTRILSNGCHWIDHFLFLNDFSRPVRWNAWVARDGTADVSLELENQAVFTMTLTERGSGRVGLQDHTELRSRGATVTITNASSYRSESPTRVLRQASRNRLAVYGTMYATIARAIAQGRKGDDPESLILSARTALDLDDALLGRA